MRAKHQTVLVRFLALLVLSLIPCTAATAAEPPAEPILRLETGMHTAPIRRIGLDADGRWLVTASDDKTVRLWELPSGRLVRVLRPPIGEGDEGKLFSAAVSPDGRQIACGGWTQFNKGSLFVASDGYAIYIFDRATGRLTGRIPGLPNVIDHLAYSPDGRYLAACLGDGGIRVYKTGDLSLAGGDEDYGGRSYGAHFSPDGRLATSSYDGYLRLYSRDFRLLAKRKAPGGSRPYSVGFSPDGQKIAVGYHDSTRVDVLSGADLSHLFSPDTTGIDNGNLVSVSWSADGRVLYAGGMYDDGTENIPIILWDDGGRGRRTSLPGAPDTIMDIRPLKDGGFAYGAAGPAWGVYDQTGRRRLFITPAQADYRALLGNFLVSSDGTRARFGYEYGGTSPAQFDVGQGAWKRNGPGTPASFRPSPNRRDFPSRTGKIHTPPGSTALP